MRPHSPPSNSPNRRMASSKAVWEIVRLYKGLTPPEGSGQYFWSIWLWATPSHCGKHLETSSYMLSGFWNCRTWASETFGFVPDSLDSCITTMVIFSNKTWKAKIQDIWAKRGNLKKTQKHTTQSRCVQSRKVLNTCDLFRLRVRKVGAYSFSKMSKCSC